MTGRLRVASKTDQHDPFRKNRSVARAGDESVRLLAVPDLFTADDVTLRPPGTFVLQVAGPPART
jgi:hypothetical protein